MRPITGEVREYTRGDGGKTFSLRITIPAWIPLRPGEARRQTLPLGRDDDRPTGWTRELAEKELERVLAHLTLGHWPIPDEVSRTASDELTVVHCGRAWIERHPEWAESTRKDRLWRLSHLEPFWSVLKPSQATVLLVDQYKAEQVRESDRLRATIAAGKPERRASGNMRRALPPSEINKFIAILAMILDDVEELHGWGPGGGIARGRRRRLNTTKTGGQFLEGDEAALFVIAARHIDRWPRATSEEPFIETVRLRDEERLPWREIARRTKVSISTAHHRYQRASRPDDGIGAFEALAITMLAAGARAAENAHLTLGDLAVLPRHFVVPGTKTVNAERSSGMTNGVYKRMAQYVHSRRHDDPGSPAFPNALGKQRDRHSIAWFVERVAARARLLAERENRPFPRHVTPHDLRRTCVALLLSPPHPYDLAFVQNHIGNSSSRLVLEVYNKLQERKDRTGPAREFDRTLFGDTETDL
ncbi:MAG: tyrosine-type recombinase/integrase [Solirubrobacteraceae bacterium]